jgi:hypothetical protein
MISDYYIQTKCLDFVEIQGVTGAGTVNQWKKVACPNSCHRQGTYALGLVAGIGIVNQWKKVECPNSCHWQGP